MASKKLKVGFIGCGRIATLHQLGYQNNPHAELFAICSTDKKELAARAKEWHVSNVYADYRQMLANPEIDIIEILTPHHTHFQIAADAAKAKKHISLQKVPVMTLKEYDDLARIVKQNHAKFRVFENFRFHHPVQRALEIIKTGKLGQVKTVNQRMWVSYKTSKEWNYPLKSLAWRIKENTNYSSPTLFDDGFHKHSLACLFLPEISSVRVWCQRAKLKGILSLDLPSIVIYETKQKDTYGTWNASVYPSLPLKSHYYSCDELIEITLERGIIIIYGCTGSMFDSANSGQPRGLDWMDAKGDWHKETFADADWKYSFINSTQNFIDHILSGAPASLDAAEARQVFKVTLAAVKSLKNNGFPIGTADKDVYTL